MEINIPATNGDVYKDLVVKYTTEIQLVSEGLVEVVPTTNKSSDFTYIIRTASDLDQDYSPCPTSSSGEITYDSKLVHLGKTMLLYTKIRPAEWENVVRKYQPVGPIVTEQLNPLIMKDMFLAFTEQYAEVSNVQTVEGKQTLLPGSTDEYLRYDGVMTIAKAKDSGVQAVAYSTVDTPAKAQALLEKLRKGVDVRVRRQKNFKYAVSQNIADLFFDSQYAQTSKGVDLTEEGVARYKGKEIHVLDALGDNEAFATVMSPNSDSNIFMVVAGEESNTAFEMGKVSNLCEYQFIKMIWKQGLGVKKHNELAAHFAPAPVV